MTEQVNRCPYCGVPFQNEYEPDDLEETKRISAWWTEKRVKEHKEAKCIVDESDPGTMPANWTGDWMDYQSEQLAIYIRTNEYPPITLRQWLKARRLEIKSKADRQYYAADINWPR